MAGFIAISASDAAIGEVVDVGGEHEAAIGGTAVLIAKMIGARMEDWTEVVRQHPVESGREHWRADSQWAQGVW